jgi:hypothetical protein
MAVKAQIVVLEGPNKGPIDVMFNPREYSVLTEGLVADENSTTIQFNKVVIRDFVLPLFFDTFEQKTDVRELTQKIADLLVPSVAGKETKQPATCLFSWGGFSYKGKIIKIDQKFTMFLTTGIPVRADLSVTFKSVVTKEEDAVFKGKEACRQFWPVKSGDRLDLIAYQTLKDPALWRQIATVNKILNPLAFPTKADIGRTIIIPDEKDLNQ